MIDFCSRILPGMDAGGLSLQACVEMVRSEMDQGVDGLVPAPVFDFSRERPDDFFLRRGAALNQLRMALHKDALQPRLYPGAEVCFFRGMAQVDFLEEMCIESSRALLVRMPPYSWSSQMVGELKIIRKVWGLQPVITNIGMHLAHQRGYVLRELCSAGVRLQADCAFFMDKASSTMALHMLKRQLIHAIGSNCPDPQGAGLHMGAALRLIQEKLGSGAIDFLQDMQKQILGV